MHTFMHTDETKLHGVPPLPKHCMRRPEQKELRAALVGGARDDGVIVSIVDSGTMGGMGGMGGGDGRMGSTSGLRAFTGIAGTAGLGKSVLASWLCRDVLVRTAYRDGAFWLEFGKSRNGFEGLARLARLLGISHREVEKHRRRNSTDLVDEVAHQLRGKHVLIVLDDIWDEEQPQPFRRLATGTVTVLMTTRKGQIVDVFGSSLLSVPLRPLDAAAALRLIVLTSGRGHATLTLDGRDARALDVLVAMCAGLPAMLRSVGRMCSNRSPQAVVQFFVTHRDSQRIPRTMARADGYNVESAKGNLFMAYEGQARTRPPSTHV